MKSSTISVLALSLLGCSSGGLSAGPVEGVDPHADPPGVTLPSSTATDRLPVLGRLQMRDRKVTLLGSRDGLRVTIEDEAGRVIARGASLDDVRQIDPSVYEICRTAVADNRGYLDARLDMPAMPGDGSLR
jgi:hypothetical protein